MQLRIQLWKVVKRNARWRNFEWKDFPVLLPSQQYAKNSREQQFGSSVSGWH